VAFSVDAGLMLLTRAEIQNAVDSGALAAALELQQDPDGIPAADDSARKFIQVNRVGMTRLLPADAIDLEHGKFDNRAGTFTATNSSPNAVRVFARQEGEPFFFARFFGLETFGVPASALAAGDPRSNDIMLVLDLSGSMRRDGRIQALWAAAPTFVDIIDRPDSDDQIGVMGLAADPDEYDPVVRGHTGTEYVSGLHASADHYVGVLESPLTRDFESLKDNVLSRSNLNAGKYTGWTGTGAAIADAAHYLNNSREARDDAEKIIVVMSDGYANKPSRHGARYARQMARYAADGNVKIYSISLGNAADVRLMRDLANTGDGEHHDATGSDRATLTRQLTEAFQQIAYAIKRVQLVE